MILDREIYLKGNSRNIKYYTDLGYEVRVNEMFLVKVEHLTKSSTAEIKCECDSCGEIKAIQWGVLVRYIGKEMNRKYYCKKCSTIKRLETNNARYGGNSPTSSPEIIKKIKKTNLERYGVDCTLHSEQSKIAVKKTWNDRYGTDSPLKNDAIRKKISKTNIERYGTEIPLKNAEVYETLKKTNMERYGVDNLFKSEDIQKSISKKMFDKWGMHYTQTEDFKNKSKKTNTERYGAENYANSLDYLKMLLAKKKHKYDNILFLDYSREEKKYSILCKECNEKFNINSDLLASRIANESSVCLKCNPIGDKYVSNAENMISEFLEEKNVQLIRTDMKSISPYHLDIVIEKNKMAIEFNGIYWHSDKFKDKYYHINKYNKCSDADLSLIQIWEDDWNNKRDIVKSILLNKIGMSDQKVYARKCHIKEVHHKEKDSFLEENHIQGKTTSSINLGLYHNNSLISLMTFGKRRTNGKSEFELIRFCNKLNTVVVGAASRLFNFFVKNYEFDKIISYSDNSYSNGDIYKKLNFHYSGTSINYYWCDGKNKYHRFNFNKKRLVAQGFDASKTEDQIMRERGFSKIWGAGNKKWIYTNEPQIG